MVSDALNSSVFVVIVTFKRPNVLSRCLASIDRQSLASASRIHIVVNSDDIETRTFIEKYSRTSLLEVTADYLDNEGPAGGFYYGIKRFIDEGNCNYVWLMDDDIEVGDNCFTELMTYSGLHNYLFPKVITGEGKEIESFGWWGVLIGREVIAQVGLPDKDFFYWAEDSEYLQHRIFRKGGIKPFRVKTAVVTHLHNRSLKRPSWYYYYTCRNTFYYRLHIVGITKYGMKVIVGLIPYLLYSIITRENNKCLKIKLLVLGFIDGIRGKKGKIIDPVSYN